MSCSPHDARPRVGRVHGRVGRLLEQLLGVRPLLTRTRCLKAGASETPSLSSQGRTGAGGEGVIPWEPLPPSGGVPHGGSRLEPQGAAGEGQARWGGEVAFLLHVRHGPACLSV